jgi:hypothetical protein
MTDDTTTVDQILKLLHSSIEHLHGPEEVSYGEDEIIIVCLVRDGRPYVKSFLEHYFSMGVKHAVFLDNNSDDGTVEALCNYENVTVLRTTMQHKGPGEPRVPFKQYLVNRFGNKDRWCLYADIDELVDYPYSDVVSLASLLRYLNSKSYTAVAAQMLDMFPEEPLSEPPQQHARQRRHRNIQRRYPGHALRHRELPNEVPLYLRRRRGEAHAR